MSRKISYQILTAITLLSIGVLTGWFLKSSNIQKVTEPSTVRKNSPDYKFINPILFTETDKSLYTEYIPLENLIGQRIKAVTDTGDASAVSVYFGDLNSGHWTGVNENENFTPGSMLKVVVLLSYLKSAEINPSILDQRLSYEATTDPGQHYKPLHPLKTDSYTVGDLLNAMIVDSDNVATKILIAHNLEEYTNIFKIFYLPIPTTDSSVTDYMSTKNYSTLFRSLFNATYLSSPVSDQALGLLTSTTFKNGLVAGVPTGTVVAHKFGEHSNILSDGTVVKRELHDCGIVYYPGKPYFLCVMTKGKDFPKLETIIAGISKLIFEQVQQSK